jgi:predicted nuclease with TOPRIM domain
VLNALHSLKQLEGLVKQASEALQKATTENRSLKDRLHKLEVEHRRLKEELKAATLTLARHERLRARLQRLSDRLERVS